MKSYLWLLFVLLVLMLNSACAAFSAPAVPLAPTSGPSGGLAQITPGQRATVPSSSTLQKELPNSLVNSSATATPEPITENSPTGDIPDNATFLVYRASKHSLQYVEGWAREQLPNEGIRFADKDSFVSVTLQPLPSGPILPYASSLGVADSGKEFEQFKKLDVKAVTLPAGQAALLTFQSLSAPDPVTGKRVRLDVNRYYILGPQSMAILTEATPSGVDNVDAFQQIVRSFVWSGR